MIKSPRDPEQHTTDKTPLFSRRQALRGLAGTAIGLATFFAVTRDIGAAEPRRGPARPTGDKPTTTTTTVVTTTEIPTITGFAAPNVTTGTTTTVSRRGEPRPTGDKPTTSTTTTETLTPTNR